MAVDLSDHVVGVFGNQLEALATRAQPLLHGPRFRDVAAQYDGAPLSVGGLEGRPRALEPADPAVVPKGSKRGADLSGVSEELREDRRDALAIFRVDAIEDDRVPLLPGRADVAGAAIVNDAARIDLGDRVVGIAREGAKAPRIEVRSVVFVRHGRWPAPTGVIGPPEGSLKRPGRGEGVPPGALLSWAAPWTSSSAAASSCFGSGREITG